MNLSLRNASRSNRLQRTIASLCLLTLPIAALAAKHPAADTAATGASSTVAIIHANLVPMDSNHLLADQTVITRGDRIVSVGATGQVKVPADAQVIDATGKYLLPGFTTTHEAAAQGQLPSYLAPGSAVQQQLRAYVAAGHTPYQALRTVTVDPARAAHQSDDCGTIAKGRRADLLLLTANPLADVANTQRVNGVMFAGRWMTPSSMVNGN